MRPYYDRAGVTIYHADCRDVLPALEATHICTDPVWPGATVPLIGRDDPQRLLAAALALAPVGVVRVAIQLGCDSDPRFLAAVPERWAFFRVCWLDVPRMSYKGRLLDGATPAYLFGAPPPSRPGAHLIPGMFRDPDPSGQQTAHPCPRKLGHVRWILAKWAALDDVVLDPFVGSGTTLVAAKALGLRAVGVEVEERYCEMAARRLDQDVLPLFGEAGG